MLFPMVSVLQIVKNCKYTHIVIYDAKAELRKKAFCNPASVPDKKG